jgi:hypothetical protein
MMVRRFESVIGNLCVGASEIKWVKTMLSFYSRLHCSTIVDEDYPMGFKNCKKRQCPFSMLEKLVWSRRLLG